MKRVQICSNEGQCPFPRRDNYEIAKLPNTKHPWVKGTPGFTNNDHSIPKKERMFFTAPNQCYDIIIALFKFVYRFEMVSQVSNVAPEPLV